MTADEIMRDEMMKAGEDLKLVELLFKTKRNDPLSRVTDRIELDAEAEADLRAYTRQLLAMPHNDFHAYYEEHKGEVKEATEIAKAIESERN